MAKQKISERQSKAAKKAHRKMASDAAYIKHAQAALDAWETIRADREN